MAKKTTTTPRSTPTRKPAAKSKAAPATTTAVLDTPPSTPATTPQVIKKSIPAVAAVGADQAAPAPSRPAPTHQQIAERAYALFQAGMPGGPTDHWLAAERELLGK